MFIAMNHFRVAEGREAEFEHAWRRRESYLQDLPGFVLFALLRGVAPGEYLSHRTWESREAFVAWTQSEAFVRGHRQGSLAGMLQGPPQLKTFEAVLVERPGSPART